MDNQNSYVVAAWNFVTKLNANDIIELIFYTIDTGIQLQSIPAIVGPPAEPSVPSLIVTVTQVAYSGPTGATGAQGLTGPQGATGSAGATGLGYYVTSSTTVNQATGPYVWTVNTVGAYVNNMYVKATATSGPGENLNYVQGTLAIGPGNTFTIIPDSILGNLNISNWVFSVAGTIGATGPGGSITPVTGSWTLAPGPNTVSFTVTAGNTYSMWVNGNIPNGIVNWNATVTLSNTNVPVIGVQYGWYYPAPGNALVLTSIPSQIIGTPGTIISTVPVVSNSNIFTFGITNNTITPQTVNYGYVKIS
jgi:hypothetical protein